MFKYALLTTIGIAVISGLTTLSLIFWDIVTQPRKNIDDWVALGALTMIGAVATAAIGLLGLLVFEEFF